MVVNTHSLGDHIRHGTVLSKATTADAKDDNKAAAYIFMVAVKEKKRKLSETLQVLVARASHSKIAP